ncbi:MAG TPA: hypothetical protein VEC99_03410 [Clostridia bacterium]|nr:hypothetical protein [Clostridia bacterium]
MLKRKRFPCSLRLGNLFYADACFHCYEVPAHAPWAALGAGGSRQAEFLVSPDLFRVDAVCAKLSKVSLV